MHRRPFLMIAIFLFLAAPLSAQRGGRGGGGPEVATTPEAPRFRYMGPQPAGRISAAVGVAGDANVYYLGAASGGVWKSTDGGANFVPIFDGQQVMAIGALAIAPTDPNTVWVGTGEAWAIRDIDVMGDGVYKSTDAGKTWSHMGLVETGRIGRIVVSPTDAQTVYVCALGRTNGPQQERGVFKSTDGGANWKQVLFVNPDTGCSGLAVDPNDPKTMLAGTWQVLMHTYGEFSGTWPGYKGTPGSGVYISHDAGDTWTKIENGMPKPPVGKIDVAIAPSNGKRMYALIQTADQGSLWRSDDGGVTWTDENWSRDLIGRAGYYIRLAVNPENPDDVLVLNSGFHRSSNGGKTFDEGRGGGGGRANAAGGAAPGGERGGANGAAAGPGGGRGASCGDCHDVWMDPKIPGRYVLTDDAGASIATPTGVLTIRLPIGQMYHVATDNRVPYWVYTNRQDNGTMRGPSNQSEGTGNGVVPGVSQTLEAAGGGRGGGRGNGRGAGGRGAPPAQPAAGAAGAAGATPPGAAPGAPPAAAGFGFGGGGGRGGPVDEWQYVLGGCESGFTIPDPVDTDIVWASCYADEVTRYDARIGRARSVAPWIHTLDSEPNKTKYRCHWTPPLAVDPFDGSVYYGCQVIFHTTDAGQSWQVISPDLSTQNPAHIVSSGGIVGDNLGQFYGEVVFAIAPSPIQRHLIWAGTNDGKIWYTKDGAHWTDVTRNLKDVPPEGTILQISPSNFDPATAYVAIDLHLMDDRRPYLFKTNDFGKTWTKISDTLPTGHPLDYMRSVAENPNRKGMLFAGTGHAFYYSLDDGKSWTHYNNGLPAAPVTWITVEKRSHDVVISTYGRGIYILPDVSLLEQTGQTMPPTSVTKLYTPDVGIRQARTGTATFDFSLASAPSGPLTFEIYDAGGQPIRKFPVVAHAGINRATWDLHYDPPEVVALRTTPVENPHVWEEPRFVGQTTRPVTHWGIETAIRAAPIAAPGKYTVKISVDGQTLSQPFEVIKDPAITSSDADLVASTRMQVKVRDDLNEAVDLTNRLEIARRQVEDQVKAHQADAAMVKALGDFDKKLLGVELQLITHSDMQSDDKYYPEQYKVYLNLIWFNGVIGNGAGDVAGGAEYRPTDASVQVLAGIESDLAAAKVAFDRVIAADLPAFNQSMNGKLPPITTSVPTTPQ